MDVCTEATLARWCTSSFAGRCIPGRADQLLHPRHATLFQLLVLPLEAPAFARPTAHLRQIYTWWPGLVMLHQPVQPHASLPSEADFSTAPHAHIASTCALRRSALGCDCAIVAPDTDGIWPSQRTRALPTATISVLPHAPAKGSWPTKLTSRPGEKEPSTPAQAHAQTQAPSDLRQTHQTTHPQWSPRAQANQDDRSPQPTVEEPDKPIKGVDGGHNNATHALPETKEEHRTRAPLMHARNACSPAQEKVRAETPH